MDCMWSLLIFARHKSEPLMTLKILNSHSRRAFTLVELLVVIAIIGILVALLLPTLGTVRESARMTHCVAAQKQLALALKTSEQASGRLPAACFYQTTDGGRQPANISLGSLPVGQSGTISSMATDRSYSSFSFLVTLLPFLDARHIYDRIDFSKSAFDATDNDPDPQTGQIYSNAALWSEPIPHLLCPSFQSAKTAQATDYAALTERPALTNYKAVSATDMVTLFQSERCKSSEIDAAGNGAGILHPYGRTRSTGFPGSTMLTSETREQNYAAWADGTTACIWGIDDDGEVAINRSLDSDDASQGWVKYTLSSEHPQAVTICLYDGSARTMSEDVEPEVLKAMITRDAADNAASANFLTAGN